MKQQKQENLNIGKLFNNKRGDVFAVSLKNGVSFIQRCSDEVNNCSIFRVFSTIYPTSIIDSFDFIYQKESYLCCIENFQKSAMVQYVGNLPIPDAFVLPSYTKWCPSLKGTDTPLQYWSIYQNNFSERISIKKYIEKHLKKKLYDLSWKSDFLNLNPTGILSISELVGMLNGQFSLESWYPAHFNEDEIIIDQLYAGD